MTPKKPIVKEFLDRVKREREIEAAAKAAFSLKVPNASKQRSEQSRDTSQPTETEPS